MSTTMQPVTATSGAATAAGGTINAEVGLVTTFKKMQGTHPAKHHKAVSLLQLIGSDLGLEKRILQLRAEVDPAKRKELKDALPIVVWAGEFSKRGNANLTAHAGLLVLDFDKLEPDTLAALRAKVVADPHTFGAFTSPSGNGLKVVVRIEPRPSNNEDHARAWQVVADHYGNKPDKSGKNVERVCFLSFDPGVYINEGAEPLEIGKAATAGVSDAELAVITKQVLARALQEGTPERPRKLLDKLLEQIEKVDFRDRAGLTAEDEKLGRKHFLVCAVEEVLAKARANHWDLCKNAAFTYVYNGAFWETVEKEELQTFLGEAAERMGVDKFEARHYVFMGQLVQQFHAKGHLPTPEPSAEVVLVNLRNGTFEIGPRGHRLRPASPADFLTYQLPFDFDPEATAPKFQAYLDKVQPDKDRQMILAESVAHVFINTATLKLEKVPLLYGTGANGKSVFFDVVNALLGGDANVSSYTLQQLTDESGYFRAKLANKLVNYASEINGKMDAAYFKSLASGEPVSARLPYGEPFTVTRYAKLMFNCNELPREVEQTDAFFRRFLLIPFEVTIPDAEQDRELSGKVIGSELSGVFNWVLDGLQRLLRQKRFTQSEAVDAALQQYRTRSDSVRSYLEEHGLQPSVDAHKPLKDIYTAYTVHCKESGSHPCALRTFAERMRNAGYTITRSNGVRLVWAECEAEIKDVF
ncbi:MAG TPA: phage/plasmid primase, P4 family [Flavobacteriales bacterium]|nr:phage/plasmid primase, P4 family [Flavobacteriales bacterium]HRP82780.1 phage/plasmid primase, P4 family [Flavobacteriales bacterium]